jgi:CDP-diacylglycerol--serine O-phosphatidyltransferase
MPDRVSLRHLAPNALTAGSAVLAIVSMTQAVQQDYVLSAWCIVWCALLDIADGRIAKWMGATSAFGLQFDSLADALAFCAAPAVLTHAVLTGDPRYAGAYADAGPRVVLWSGLGFYVVGGLVRLARYNLQRHDTAAAFAGLPTTLAGALVATYLLSAWELGLPDGAVVTSKRGRLVSGIYWCGAVLIYGLGITQSFPSVLLGITVVYPLIGLARARHGPGGRTPR